MSLRVLRLLRVLAVVVRTYGLRGLARRSVHELRRRSGRYRTRPRLQCSAAGPWLVTAYAPAGTWNDVSEQRRGIALERAARVVAGEYQAYSHEWRTLPRGAGWRIHPHSGYEFPACEWWKVPLLPPQSDVKDVWEPARFTWLYDLVRAHAIAPHPNYRRTFESRLCEWMAANPPFYGPQWACGQETAIRALAILHAEAGLGLACDAAAAADIERVLCWSAERIEDAIGYGLSQRNNHGISEAAGLVHLGIRLRGRHPRADLWVRYGRRWLEEQIDDQFAADGWYAQHSFTYMRVALDQALLAQNILSRVALSLSPHVLSKLAQAFELLCSVVDELSGVVPNYGANDGALILPYSTSQYRDFRPLLTFAATTLRKPLPADIAADEEVIAWMDAYPDRGAARADGVRDGSSGYVAVRLAQVAVFLRAGRYTHRPSHLDALHIDVRIDNQEVVTDAGTFSYNSPPLWKNALAVARVHNGPLLDGEEPALRGPRFLWYSWPEARVLEVGTYGTSAHVVAEVPGRVRRRLYISPEGVTVDDQALAASARLEVTWLMHPGTKGRQWVLAPNAELITASEDDIIGWFSPTYGSRVASVAIRIRVEAPHSVQLKCCTRIRRPGGIDSK